MNLQKHLNVDDPQFAAIALAALADNAGFDSAMLIHDLDGTGTGACAPDCAACTMPEPTGPALCQWCGEVDHDLNGCADFAARIATRGAS